MLIQKKVKFYLIAIIAVISFFTSLIIIQEKHQHNLLRKILDVQLSSSNLLNQFYSNFYNIVYNIEKYEANRKEIFKNNIINNLTSIDNNFNLFKNSQANDFKINDVEKLESQFNSLKHKILSYTQQLIKFNEDNVENSEKDIEMLLLTDSKIFFSNLERFINENIDKNSLLKLEIYNNYKNLNYSIIAFSFCILINFTAIVLFILRSVTTPLSKINKVIQEISQGNMSKKIQTTSNKDEIANLTIAFNEMIDRIRLITVSRDDLLKEINDRYKIELKLIKTKEEIEDEKKHLEDINSQVKELMKSVIKNIKVRYENSYLKRCKIVKKCDEKDCPAYNSPNLRCWQIEGTECCGQANENLSDKINSCMNCEVYKIATQNEISSIGEQFNNLLYILDQRLNQINAFQIKCEFENQTNKRFINNMCKEIRENLHPIANYINALEKNITDEKLRKTLFNATNNLNFINDLLDKISDFVNTELGLNDLVLEDFNIEYLLSDVFDRFEIILQDQPIETRLIIDDNIPKYLKGDPFRLRQILINLLDNAVNFTERGLISINVSLINDDSNNPELKFVISDTGTGIPAENQKLIFTSFNKISNKKNKFKKSAGMGLAICKQIINKMNGNIWVESEQFKGSSFIFTAKFLKSNELIYSVDLRNKEVLKHKKVLILDDKALIINQIIKTVEQLEMVVINAEESLNKFLHRIKELSENNTSVDIAFLNITIKGIYNFDIVSEIKNKLNRNDILFVATTSLSNHSISEFAKNKGFNALIEFPQDNDIFEDVLCAAFQLNKENIFVTHHFVKELNLTNQNRRNIYLIFESNNILAEIYKSYLSELRINCEIINNLDVKPNFDLYSTILLPVNIYNECLNVLHIENLQKRKIILICDNSNKDFCKKLFTDGKIISYFVQPLTPENFVEISKL